MTRTTIRSEDITAGQVKSADLASDAVDTSGLEDDIAILGFKVASNGSLSKYDLVDQTIDDFQDAAGIDTGGSTNEIRNASNYYSGKQDAAWVTGDRTSSVTVTSDMSYLGSPDGSLPISTLVNGSEAYSDAGGGWFTAGQNGYIRFDHGSGNSEVYTNSRWVYQSSSADEGTYKWQGSNDAASWTDIGGNFTLTASGGGPNTDTHATMTSNTTFYRYYQCIYVSGNNTNGSGRRMEMQFYRADLDNNMTLVSNSTTAEATPTKGDIVMTYTNGSGTATVNTDIKAYVSRDNGTTYTQATLSSEGTTGGHTILTAHNVDISSQPSGTSMRYKIETLNQSASKETRIQAVSLGWA